MECGKEDHRVYNLVLERRMRIEMQIICQSEKYSVFLHNLHDTRQ